jgi:peptidoglycan/xylan/chitin deacetylase (PgdA/CDA1 family)
VATGFGAKASALDLNRLSLGSVPMVLMYHNIGEVAEDPHDICVTSARFAEQLAWLADQGLRGVSMCELIAAIHAGTARGLVGLTFDDGYVNVLENAVPELVRHGFTATMFIVTGQLGGTNAWDDGPVWPLMSADQVRQVAAAGMEIGAHSATHTRLAGVGADRLATEVGGSRSDLGELMGHPIRGFAYPWGNMDAAARQAVREAGFDYACSVETPLRNLGIVALPRIVFSQRDGVGRMAAKKFFFKSYTVAKGTRRQLSYNPRAQAVKRRLSELQRSVRAKAS